MIRRILSIVAPSLALAAIAGGCAKHPDSIAASYVSHMAYRGLTCDDLAQETSRLNSVLTRAATQQENARTTDAVGIILLGLPVSTLSGDNIAPEIARLKGEQEAMHRQMLHAGCGGEATGPTGRRVEKQDVAAPIMPMSSWTARPAEMGVRREYVPVRQQRRDADAYRVMMQDIAY